jgi:hypothetical protein
MTETPYKLARRQTDQALVIFDDEGQELICLPERVRAEFGEAILAAVNEAHAAGARACRERIQGASMQAIEEYRQSLWGIEPGWGSFDALLPGASIDPERDEATLREHLTGWHIYDAGELPASFEGLLTLHRGVDGDHPYQRTPHSIKPRIQA